MIDGFVYFIEARDSGRIKIGFSTDPNQRVRGLGTGASEELLVLAVVPGSRATEMRLHNRFLASHSHKEWFHATPDLRAFVEGVRFLLEVQALAPRAAPRRLTAEEYARRARERSPLPSVDVPALERGTEDLLAQVAAAPAEGLPKRRAS